MCFVRVTCALHVLLVAATVAASAMAAANGDDVIFPDQRHRARNGGAGASTSATPTRAPETDAESVADHRHRHQQPATAAVGHNAAIPLSLAKELSAVVDAEQFVRQYVENGDRIVFGQHRPQSALVGASASFRLGMTGGGGGGGSAAKATAATLSQATCKPELRTVSLRDTSDPTLYYYPSCVRLDRCGGCCSHDLLNCQPTTERVQNVTVYVSRYVGTKTLKYVGAKTVPVSVHEKCACGCRIKPEDCDAGQTYRPDDCRCTCANDGDEKACGKHFSKLWNPAACRCECRETHECSSGYYYNQNQCACARTPQEVEYAHSSNYRFGGA